MRWHTWTYLIGGGATIAIALFAGSDFRTTRRSSRTNTWCCANATGSTTLSLSGARRQIFIVFAGFLPVEKFDYDVGAVAALYLLNAAINIPAAPAIGRMIARFGERTLIVEYIGLIGVFAAFALVDNGKCRHSVCARPPVFCWPSPCVRTFRKLLTLRTSPQQPACLSPSTMSRRWCCQRSTASCNSVASTGIFVAQLGTRFVDLCAHGAARPSTR